MWVHSWSACVSPDSAPLTGTKAFYDSVRIANKVPCPSVRPPGRHLLSVCLSVSLKAQLAVMSTALLGLHTRRRRRRIEWLTVRRRCPVSGNNPPPPPEKSHPHYQICPGTTKGGGVMQWLTRQSWSTKLLYTGPGYSWDGRLSVCEQVNLLRI